MLSPLYAARQAWGTVRGWRLFVASLLVAFGLVSAVSQFVGQFFPEILPSPGVVTLVALGVCVAWGLVRVWPREPVRQDFTHPQMTVTVTAGDLFSHRDAHLVVGFSDTFDTSVAGDEVISRASVQGQLVERLYDCDHRRLDRELRAALGTVAPVSVETRESKRLGKLARYPVSTVAVVGGQRRVFAVACSRMGNDLVAQSSVRDLWLALHNLWDAIYGHGQRRPVAMPLLGSGLARLDYLDRQSLLKLILLSFVLRSRHAPVCRELRIVIWPTDLDAIDMLEIKDFLAAL